MRTIRRIALADAKLSTLVLFCRAEHAATNKIALFTMQDTAVL